MFLPIFGHHQGLFLRHLEESFLPQDVVNVAADDGRKQGRNM
jgi:hypothetical protein